MRVVNTVWKSGTHLALAVLEELGVDQTDLFISADLVLGSPARAASIGTAEQMEDGVDVGLETPALVPASWLDDYLSSAKGGSVGAHLPHSAELADVIFGAGGGVVQVLRDPRAVAHSFASWIVRPGSYFLRAGFEGFSYEQVLDRLLTGFQLNETWIRPISEVFQVAMPWQDDPRCLVLSFESLVGHFGEAERRASVSELAAYFGLPQREVELASYFGRSHTFAHGSVDGWRDVMPSSIAARLEREVAPYVGALQLRSSGR